MKYFGENLKYLRKISGLTQSNIKDRLGIAATTWGNYERNQSFPNLSLFSEITKYFGVSAQDLLFEDLQKGNLNPNLINLVNTQKGNLKGNRNGNLNSFNVVNEQVEQYGNSPAKDELIRTYQELIDSQRQTIKLLQDRLNEKVT